MVFGNFDQCAARSKSALTNQLVSTIFTLCYGDRVGYMMEESMVHQFINISEL